MRKGSFLVGCVSLLIAVAPTTGLALDQEPSSGNGPRSEADAPAVPNWVLAAPATSPPARPEAAMAYDGARGRVVLFGGGSSHGLLADTWEWDGDTWVEKTAGTRPSARDDHAMAYDSARERVVLFGGWAGGLLGDTWEWDGSAWLQRLPATSPPAREYHAMVYDGARGRAVLFGGWGYGYLADTWEWDGSAWLQRLPATSPPARNSHAMAYDSLRGRVVLFGGSYYDGVKHYLADTWEWDGNTWVERTPIASPPARVNHAMAYDSARGRVVLFGGCSESSCPAAADTWEWDGSAWVQMTPGASPPALEEHAMAYDGARGRVVLFGGCSESNCRAADTWEYGCAVRFYRDADGDGQGDSASTSQACAAPAGFVADGGDCNDNDPAVHSGAPEICNGIDDNCNGEVDEDAQGAETDGDGVHNACDRCPNTPGGEVVNAAGCGISQLAPASWPWKNHGEYVSAVARVSGEFVAQGLITPAQRAAIVSAAARSDVGKRG